MKEPVEIYFFCIGGINIEIVTDVPIPLIKQINYKQFQINKANSQAVVNIIQNQTKPSIFPPLNKKECDTLLQTVGFNSRWLKNPILRSPQIRKALSNCYENPDLVYVEMAWNRIIIQNFAKKEFFYFYPISSKYKFSNQLFIAGLRNLLNVVFPSFCGILIHSSGMKIGNNGALFLAPDGGGKTTFVKKHPSDIILSDDQIILSKKNGNYFMSSTPFGTMTCGLQCTKIGGIFLLKKSSKTSVRPIASNEILKFIWNEHFSQIMKYPKPLRINLFNMLYQICHQIPTYHLFFPKSGINLEILKEVMLK